jgi:hypothetical protein
VKGKSTLSDSDLSDLVAYFDEKVREALLTDDLPFPFRKFDASRAIEYEATLRRISKCAPLSWEMNRSSNYAGSISTVRCGNE